MARLRGIVLDNQQNQVILLTDNGEYRKVASGGRRYPVGAEVELPTGRRPLWAVAAACAALFLFSVIALSLVPQPAGAYLVMDVNPSLFISLAADGRVRSAEGLNEDGEMLLRELSLKGLPAAEAVNLLLIAAHAGSYLSLDRENIVVICLAAPSGFIITEQELYDSVTGVISDLQLDAFVAVPLARPEEALAARSRGQSVNAVMIRKQLSDRGLLSADDGTGPPPTVRELLEQLPPSDLAGMGQHVGGRAGDDDHQHGPPEFAPASPGNGSPPDAGSPPGTGSPPDGRTPGPPTRPPAPVSPGGKGNRGN